jgi:hypothetical protein
MIVYICVDRYTFGKPVKGTVSLIVKKKRQPWRMRAGTAPPSVLKEFKVSHAPGTAPPYVLKEFKVSHAPGTAPPYVLKEFKVSHAPGTAPPSVLKEFKVSHAKWTREFVRCLSILLA